ncbi:MAG: hypothetical protein HYV41_03660 [Candidatus Magasanikbacteria bacterium]|nr:hypothetical protein [Candidatus Magasanikbacteria bacterium]
MEKFRHEKEGDLSATYQRLLQCVEQDVRRICVSKGIPLYGNRLEDQYDIARAKLQDMYMRARASDASPKEVDDFLSLSREGLRLKVYDRAVIDALRYARYKMPELVMDPQSLFYQNIRDKKDSFVSPEELEQEIIKAQNTFFAWIDRLEFVFKKELNKKFIKKIKITDKKRTQFKNLIQGLLDGKNLMEIAPDMGISDTALGNIYYELGESLIQSNFLETWPKISLINVDRKKI